MDVTTNILTHRESHEEVIERSTSDEEYNIDDILSTDYEHEISRVIEDLSMPNRYELLSEDNYSGHNHGPNGDMSECHRCAALLCDASFVSSDTVASSHVMPVNPETPSKSKAPRATSDSDSPRHNRAVRREYLNGRMFIANRRLLSTKHV